MRVTIRMRMILGSLLCAASAAVGAAMPVVDVSAISQLAQQVNAWRQQLAGMQQQLLQLRATRDALTGGRGMEQLIRLTPQARNYLPPDWQALTDGLNGALAQYGQLAAAVRAQQAVNTVLPATELDRIDPGLAALLGRERQQVAVDQTLARLAYARSSDRFTTLTTLIDRIGVAPDAKAIGDLQGRIAAEQAMLANEGLKLMALSQATAADRSARELERREAVLAGSGRFATRFQPVPPAP